MRAHARVHALIICLTSATAPAHGQCDYDLVLIQAPNCGFGGQPGSLFGIDINEAGEIVGDIGCVAGRIAYRWREDLGLEALDLGVDTGSSWATGINDAGVITGYYESSDGALVSGFILDSGRVETVPPPAGGNRLRPRGISNTGTIFGHWGNNVSGPGVSAFIRRNGYLDTLDGVIDANASEITDVNADGVYAGWRSDGGLLEGEAFMLSGKTLVRLAMAPGGSSSEAHAINDDRVVVGGTLPGRNAGILQVATIWWGDRVTTIEPFAEHEISSALDINNVGQVVGTSRLGAPSRGFLWQNDSVHDLNDLLALPITARISQAWAINDRGVITGQAVESPSGFAFVMSPRRTSDADITIDCTVDLHDLMFLLERWGTSNEIADLNVDGTVGFADMTLLLGEWG